MQKWEEKILDWEKGKSEGLSEGRNEGELIGKAKSIIEILETRGEVSEMLRDKIMTQRDMEVLSSLLKKAIKVSSVQEFADLIAHDVPTQQ